MANKKVTKSKSRGDIAANLIKVSGVVMSKVGVIGFIVICIVVYIFLYVPQELKNEITKTWILFKCADCQNIYVIFLVCLVILFFVQNRFYRHSIKLKDMRIQEISKEKSELQHKLLGKQLKSSNIKST